MAPFEAAYESAISAGILPGVVLLAADVTGKLITRLFPKPQQLNWARLTRMYAGNFTYTKAKGVQSVRAETASKPLDPETIIAIASCTKLLTAIAVLQCVEDGVFTLDEDVTRLLPSLASIPIISSATDPATNPPTLRARQNPVTLRYLTTQITRLPTS